MYTINSIKSIKNEVTLLDNLVVRRLGNDGEGALFRVMKRENCTYSTLFTGSAGKVSEFLNQFPSNN